jgi:hypothetical protein
MKEPVGPRTRFDLNTPYQIRLSDDVVWAYVLNTRFCIEVVTKREYTDLSKLSEYGDLRIFDSIYENKLIHNERVSIAYGARFGVSYDDVRDWTKKSTTVINNKFKRN